MENILVLNGKKYLSRYLYNIAVAPNNGHKDKLHYETVKIRNIFRYMGKTCIQRQGCHYNNNCYRLSQGTFYLKGQFTQKCQFCHLQLTWYCKKEKKNCLVQHFKIKNKDSCTHAWHFNVCGTKISIQSKLRAGTECLCAFSISRYTFGSECILKFSQHFATIIMPYYNENAIPSVLTPKSKCI